MGGLLIKNKELRCKDCFSLYSIKIKPQYPSCKISKKCKCSTIEMEISKFLSEYKKNKNLSISCSNCKKTNPSNAKYCHECNKLYCGNCVKSLHNEKNNNKDHKLIVIDKYDFFCIFHQNEIFCGYCQTCKINLCIKCGEEKLHKDHNILLYHKIYDEKKMREYLKKAIKSAENKIDYNKKIGVMIVKELKNKELAKSLKTLNELNEDENRKMLELINIFYELYDINKTKNFALITNMIDNMDFNFERIKFEKNTTKENDAQKLINYLKTNFVFKSKEKPKEEVPSTLEEQFFNDNFNKFDGNEEKKDEGKDGTSEGKKEEEKKEEEKKEEEKKEEEKQEEEKKEEEEEDDGHVKTLKEKTQILEKKINEKGGFQQGDSTPITTKNSDIINAPKGNPEEVVKIISSQTINKNAKKKKPKKINFQE